MELLKKAGKVTSVSLLALVTIAPVIFLIAGSVKDIILTNESLVLSFSKTLFLESLGLVLGASLVCSFLGLLAALALWMVFDKKIDRLAVIALILFLIPVFVHVQSWIFFVDGIFNLINRLSALSLNFSGRFAVLITMAFSCLPLPTGLILLALKAIPKEIEQMVIIDGPDLKAFLRIYVPYLLPALGVSVILVFLLNINDYGISSVFGVNTYALELFAQFSAGLSSRAVFFNGLPLMLTSLCLVTIFAIYLQKNSFLLADKGGSSPFKASKTLKIITLLGMTIVLLFVFVPSLSLFYEMSQSADWIGLITGSFSEIFYSITISGLTAVIAFVPAFFIALLFFKSSLAYWLIGLSAIPFIIPGPILGLALIEFYNTPLLAIIYQSPLMPVVALVSKYTFIEVIILLAALSSIDRNHLESLAVHWPGYGLYIKCLLELLGKKHLGALLIVFALAMGEFGVSLLVTPPGYQTLTIKIYNYLHYGASDVVAALCLLMIGIILLVVLGLFMILRRQNDG